MAGQSDALIIAIHAAAIRAATAHGCAADCARAIAEDLCLAIRKSHGGERHYVARHDRQSRDAEIIAQLDSGDPPAVVAARSGVHRTTVIRVKRRSIAPDGWEL